MSGSEEIRPSIGIDAEGHIVAIEILDAKDHLSGGLDLARLSAA